MYHLSDQQIDFILKDITDRGIHIESLQQGLLDHICCIIEEQLEANGDFESFYQTVIKTFYKNELREIEDETISLLTFKHYYAMKKSMITTGAISVSMLIMGSLFKIMHWPGAGVLLVLGIGTLSFVFLPLMFILKTKDKSSPREKLILAVASIVGILLCLATLFTVQHWPGGGNGILWLSAICLSTFVLIPLYFFTGIRNPETKVNTIVTSIVLVGATALLFTMINTRPAYKPTQLKMYTYVQGEELLQKIKTNSGFGTKEIDNLALEIDKDCNKIKQLILLNSIGQPVIPKDFEDKDILLEEGVLGNEFMDEGEGSKLFADLKIKINQYNSTVKETGKQISIKNSIVDVEPAKIGRFNNYLVLTCLTQFQMLLANS